MTTEPGTPADQHFPATIRRTAADGLSSSSTSPTKMPGQPTLVESQSEPAISVTKGNPSAEELAAVTAVVLAMQSGPDAEPELPATRQWSRRAQLNLAPKPGPGAWRRSVR